MQIYKQLPNVYRVAIGLGIIALTAGVAPPVVGLGGGRPASDPNMPLECSSTTARVGEATKAASTLQYAAEQGNPVAQWKLGRMYAKGDGVPHCDLRAFEYFSRIANGHADDYPDAPQAPFVANA